MVFRQINIDSIINNEHLMSNILFLVNMCKNAFVIYFLDYNPKLEWSE